MHGCKPIDTPLLGGWRKEDATSAEVVDATFYQQLVGFTYVSGQYMTRYMLCH